MDKAPATIGKYRIERILGRGGMGTVYEALDPVINRKLAIKIMIAGLADAPDLRARFLREAQAAGGLRHRNIVTVYDLGEDKGQPYIAMEFIEGIDLEKIIQRQEPHPLEWKLEVIRQICDGLAFAHRAGIIHRDIKPANIRVTHEGEVKIMDFGIAHLQSSTMTKSGLVLGTVHYMAPEQVAGAKPDHRADIFSVGAIAYELLAGKRPFDGDSLTAVMFKVMHDRPDPGTLPKTEYSPALENIVMRALARDLGERYATLDEMEAELAALQQEGQARGREQRTDPAQALLQAAREQRAALRLGQAANLVREALKVAPGHVQATSLLAELEGEERAQRVGQAIEQGRAALTAGDLEKAHALAQQALQLAPSDAAAQTLLADVQIRHAEGRKREFETIRGEMHRARTEGQLQKALSLAQRLVQLNPDDRAAQRDAADIEGIIRDREVEQLCGMALGYVADAEHELAQKIAQRIERLAPDSPRYKQLRSYLDEESRRRSAEALTRTAQDQLALGNLREALAIADEALRAAPHLVLAREIRDRAAVVLASQELHSRKQDALRASATGATPAPPSPAPVESPLAPAPPPPLRQASPAPEPAPEPPLPPQPVAVPVAPVRPPAPAVPRSAPQVVAPPPVPVAPTAAPAPVPVAARPPVLVEPAVPRAAPVASLPATAPAAAPKPEPKNGEVEALNNAALDHFLSNNYAKARKAAEKVLALDPRNKKAKDLMKILGPLG